VATRLPLVGGVRLPGERLVGVGGGPWILAVDGGWGTPKTGVAQGERGAGKNMYFVPGSSAKMI